MEWKDVNKCLPSESGRYLGYMGKTDIYRFDHTTKEFYRDLDSLLPNVPCVVHYWMQLPLAPKVA